MCYIKFDKELLKTGLSPRAMILYALISDRLSLSKQNGWCDSFGTYCYYTMESIAEEMCIEKRQARRLIAELEAAELILRQRQSGNRTKPFKIYIAPINEGTKMSSHEGTKMSSHEGTKMSSHEGTKMSSHEGTKMSPESEQYKSTNINHSSSVDELISSAEAQTGKSLSEEGRKKIRNAIAKNKEKIGNLQAYVRRCVINTAVLDTLEPEPAGYAPTYDIAEYESQSITDFMHSGEEPEPQTQKTENLTIPDQKL